MVMVPMRDKDTTNITTFRSLCYEHIEIGIIINRRVNHRRTLGAFTKNNRIGTRSRHDRGIGGQDDGIRILHMRTPASCYIFVICAGTFQALFSSPTRCTRVTPFSWTRMGIRGATYCVVEDASAPSPLPQAPTPSN